MIEDQNYRFNEPILAIERMVRTGKLGDVRDVDVRMSLGIRGPGSRYADENLPHPSHALPAGVIHEFITHLCYLALRFLPGFDQVASSWSNHGSNGPFKYDDLDALVIGRNVHARIRFSCTARPECFTVTVRGTKGTVETDLFQTGLRAFVPRAAGRQLTPLVNQFANGWGEIWSSAVGLKNKVLQRTPLHGVATFLEQVYAALRNGAEPPVTYDDMDQASRLIESLLDEGNRF